MVWHLQLSCPLSLQDVIYASQLAFTPFNNSFSLFPKLNTRVEHLTKKLFRFFFYDLHYRKKGLFIVLVVCNGKLFY